MYILTRDDEHIKKACAGSFVHNITNTYTFAQYMACYTTTTLQHITIVLTSLLAYKTTMKRIECMLGTYILKRDDEHIKKRPAQALLDVYIYIYIYIYTHTVF